MPEILVSIWCATYNHEAYIANTIDGFLAQKTDFDFEVLIHDDASTDLTQNIIREYEKKYPKIIKPIYQTQNQHSLGVNIAACHQYPRTRGKYIALCEGDDFWIDSGKLAKQVAFLESNSEYIASYHQSLIIDGTENLLARYSQTFFFVNTKAKIFTYKDAERFFLPGQTATAVFRKCAIDSYNLLHLAPLYDFVLVAFLSMIGNIYIFPDIMSIYRKTIIGDSYSARTLYKSDINIYNIRAIIENKSQTVFGIPFHYRDIKEKDIIDALINYLKGRDIAEIALISQLFKHEKKIYLVSSLVLRIIVRIITKLEYTVYNFIFFALYGRCLKKYIK